MLPQFFSGLCVSLPSCAAEAVTPPTRTLLVVSHITSHHFTTHPTMLERLTALKVALSKYSPTTPGATLFGKVKLKVGLESRSVKYFLYFPLRQ